MKLNSKDENCPENEHDDCICPDIFGRDHLAEKRLDAIKCKERIKVLAEPKFKTKKHSPETFGTKKPYVQVFRAYEEQTPVRIRLLAYPKVRKLLSARTDYKKVVDEAWLKRFDGLIKKSLLTLYSRLANINEQKPPKPKKKWNDEDWENHLTWLESRAKPKKIHLPPKIERKRAPLEALIPRVQLLAEPKHMTLKYKPKKHNYRRKVPKSSEFVCPKRSALLAKPKKIWEPDDFDIYYQVKPLALTAQISEHVTKLAQPKKRENPIIRTDFRVDAKALSAKPSERVIELSKPVVRAFNDPYIQKPLVEPKALKAKPSKRIIELSKPRTIEKK